MSSGALLLPDEEPPVPTQHLGWHARDHFGARGDFGDTLDIRLASFWGAKCIIECGYHMCYSTIYFCTFIKYEYTYLCIVLFLDVLTFSYDFLFRQNMHGIFGTSHLSPDIQLTKDVLKEFALGPVISSQEVE